MKIIIEKIEEIDFDIKETMGKLGYKSLREVAKKVGIHWTYLSKISKGLPCPEKTAKMIMNKMLNPKDCHF